MDIKACPQTKALTQSAILAEFLGGPFPHVQWSPQFRSSPDIRWALMPDHPLTSHCPFTCSHLLTSDGCNHHWLLQVPSLKNPSKDFVQGTSPKICSNGIHFFKSLFFLGQNSAIFDNFPLLKVKNMGKFFHNFFAGWGKNKFLWQNIHKRVGGSRIFKSLNSKLLSCWTHWAG